MVVFEMVNVNRKKKNCWEIAINVCGCIYDSSLEVRIGFVTVVIYTRPYKTNHCSENYADVTTSDKKYMLWKKNGIWIMSRHSGTYFV